MTRYLLLPPDPNEPADDELTIKEKQELVEELKCLDIHEVFEALTKAWSPDDLVELAKLLMQAIGGRIQ